MEQLHQPRSRRAVRHGQLALVRDHGGRLVWGSDWPHVTETDKPYESELLSPVRNLLANDLARNAQSSAKTLLRSTTLMSSGAAQMFSEKFP